jgi:hypothetical protein
MSAATIAGNAAGPTTTVYIAGQCGVIIELSSTGAVSKS